MNRKSLLAGVIAIAISSSSAFALDFGLDLSNVSTLSGTIATAAAENELSLDQVDEAALWLSLPIGDYSTLYVSGLYRFSGLFSFIPASVPDLVPYIFTAGRVEWDGFKSINSNSGFRWSVGRVQFQDFSGKALSGMFDGASAEYAYGSMQFSASAFYTGLTFKEDANILIDSDDEAQYAASVSADPATWVALPRVVGSLRAKVIELLPLHDFGIDAWGQFDVYSAGTVATHTQYIEPYIEGRFGRSLRWRLWGIVELGEDPEFFYSMAAGTRFRYALPEILGLRLTASALWASGDYDATGSMRAFSPITTTTIATIGSANFSDSLCASLEASIAPLRGVTVSVNGATVFQPGAAVAAETYIGSEGSLRAVLKLVSDFDLTVSGGIFVPNSVISSDVTYSFTASAQVRL